MKIACPHCSQRVSIDADSLTSLGDSPGFNCPACSRYVVIPEDVVGGREDTPAPRPSPRGGWVAPGPEELAASFDSRYRIRRLLGRGGMGAVYEGFDTRLDRRVAIKILPDEAGDDPHTLARFEREAKAMAALDHPNIVHIHDYGQTSDGNPYLVMEFIDGMDVHQLRRSGALDLPGALDLISQVCSALQYAHARGIIHRDIKPANIMVTTEGVAKVADFGLAKVLGSEAQPQFEPTLTMSGAVMGTPDYMAPEQLEGGRIDHRADIYSLGVMLYDLLTGSPPRGAWPPPSERVQIDIRLDEIVLRALQQNPSSRYQAASEVRADIDSVKSSTGGEALPPGVDPAPLPSSMASSQPLRSAPATRGAAHRANTKPGTPSSPADEIADTSGGLANTMLILGLLAIAITGGLAFYLANRKTGDTYSFQQTVNDTEENNISRVTRHIPPGLTLKDVEPMGDILPYEGGFIGISMDALDWTQAQELATRTGAELLSVDESEPGWKPLHAWLQTSFPAAMTSKAWARNGSEARLLDSEKVTVPDSPGNPTPELRHKVLLHWQIRTPSSSSPTVPPTSASGDWIDLFDGRDVSKWQGTKDPAFPDGAWGIEDGALRNFHGANHQDLETREKFGDFELEFEWKLSPGGNSGIFYGQREFQLVDDAGHANGKVPVTSCGALCYFIPPNTKKRINPAGEYNRGKLIVRGNQVEHWINGEKVVEYELGSQALETLVESGRFKDLPGYRKIDINAVETRIGLQSHGGNVWFKNIRIRKLDGSEAGSDTPSEQETARASPQAIKETESPGNWTFVSWGDTATGPESAFIVTKDNILICPQENKAWYLMTRRSYGAMKFSIEFNHPKGASGGHGGQVVVGSPGPRDLTSSDYAQRIPLGFEFKLRPGVCGQLELPRVDYPAELPFGQIRDGRRVGRSRQKDPLAGAWNKLEIECTEDNSVIARLNGEVINAVAKVESVEGRIALWPIDGIHFRNPTVTHHGKVEKLDFTLADTAVEAPAVPPPPSPGPLPWTNTDGKTIQAEFVRLESDSVVIRKDGKEFTLPLAKLSPESRNQAQKLSAHSDPAPR